MSKAKVVFQMYHCVLCGEADLGEAISFRCIACDVPMWICLKCLKKVIKGD